MLGFGADMVLALAADTYVTRMLIDEKEAPMYTPSQDWAGGVRGMRRKWRGEGERRWRSEREGMTRTMKGKVHPPPT